MAEQKEPKPKGQKGKQAEKAEGTPSPGPAKKKDEKRDENFRYIIRLVNTDVDGNKDVVIGLNSVKGVGIRTAEIIAKMAGIPRKTKMGDLSEEKTTELEKLITDYSEKVPHWMVNRQSDWSSGADMHLVGVDVEMFRRDDVNMMRMIRCYKGIRHETGQKVRGQRTRSNGRTGMTMGVMRKKEGPAQAGEAAPEKKE